MKYTNANVDKVLRALLEGPVGKQIEDQAEVERAAQCSELRGEYEATQAKYLAELQSLEGKLNKLEVQVKAAKAQFEPLQQEWLKISWLRADKQGAMTEHRDRCWKGLCAVADPRIAVYRQEFEARLNGVESIEAGWVTGPARSPFERPPTTNNYQARQRAAQYLVAAVDATGRWAREGLQGEAVDHAYHELMAVFPRVPMSADDRNGVIPPALPR